MSEDSSLMRVSICFLPSSRSFSKVFGILRVFAKDKIELGISKDLTHFIRSRRIFGGVSERIHGWGFENIIRRRGRRGRVWDTVRWSSALVLKSRLNAGKEGFCAIDTRRLAVSYRQR